MADQNNSNNDDNGDGGGGKGKAGADLFAIGVKIFQGLELRRGARRRKRKARRLAFQILAQAQERRKDIRRAASVLRSTQRAAFGAAGVDPTFGSAGVLQQRDLEVSILEEQRVIQQAERIARETVEAGRETAKALKFAATLKFLEAGAVAIGSDIGQQALASFSASKEQEAASTTLVQPSPLVAPRPSASSSVASRRGNIPRGAGVGLVA